MILLYFILIRLAEVLLLILLTAMTAEGGRAVQGISKAGMWVGVIAVAIVINFESSQQLVGRRCPCDT